LLARIRSTCRVQHLSPRTEKAHLNWIRRFVAFSGGRHPLGLGEREVWSFLSHLATARSVSASTQNQALAALLFLDGEVLERRLPWLENLVRAKRPTKLPVVSRQGRSRSCSVGSRVRYGSPPPSCMGSACGSENA
jgi:hypothetical protein